MHKGTFINKVRDLIAVSALVEISTLFSKYVQLIEIYSRDAFSVFATCEDVLGVLLIITRCTHMWLCSSKLESHLRLAARTSYQWVEFRTLGVEVVGSKPALGIW